MAWNDVPEWVQAISVLFGGGFALQTYRRATETRRAEWLASMHGSFFESGRHERIRELLDYRTEPEFSELMRSVDAGERSPIAGEFFRYLNFFEFVAGLRDLNQFTDEEIRSLFDYYLRNLLQHDFVRKAVGAQGFEKLDGLMREWAGVTSSR